MAETVQVSYLGNKQGMVSQGYDFSNGPTDVPVTDDFAISKFLGNRYFHVSDGENVVAPKFWVCPIRRIFVKNDMDTGRPIYRTIQERVKLYPAKSKQDALEWIKRLGPRNADGKTHWILPNDEGISEPPEDSKPNGLSLGIFRVKDDGEPWSKPDKEFTGTGEAELKEQAVAYLEGKGIKPEDRIFMVK